MKLSLVALLGAAIAAAACSDQAAKQAKADSSLSRDLALAGAATPEPTFQDTSVAPAPVKAAPEVKEPPAPVRRRTPPPPVLRRRPDIVSQPAPVSAPQVVAAAPAPAPERGEIASGSSAELTSTTKICTTSSMAGDKLAATLDAPIMGTHGAELPAGSTVVLEVASVQSGDKAENAQITFRVRSIVVNDRTYSVAADAVPTSPLDRAKAPGGDPNAKKKVIGGAIAGALLGQLIGHDTKGTVIGAAAGAAAGAAVSKAGEKWEACLPAGAHLRLKLNEPLVLM
jgi:hypothetical protein